MLCGVTMGIHVDETPLYSNKPSQIKFGGALYSIIVNLPVLLGGSDVTSISVVPRPSMPPVFDRLQYAKMEGEGLGNFIT